MRRYVSDLFEVLEWLLCPQPELRATVSDMEGDPWVQQPISICDYSWNDVLPNSGAVQEKSTLHYSGHRSCYKKEQIARGQNMTKDMRRCFAAFNTSFLTSKYNMALEIVASIDVEQVMIHDCTIICVVISLYA